MLIKLQNSRKKCEAQRKNDLALSIKIESQNILHAFTPQPLVFNFLIIRTSIRQYNIGLVRRHFNYSQASFVDNINVWIKTFQRFLKRYKNSSILFRKQKSLDSSDEYVNCYGNLGYDYLHLSLDLDILDFTRAPALRPSIKNS